MKAEPLKDKLRFKDEDDLANYACEVIFKCSGEQPNESDPTGCCGCDAQHTYEDNIQRDDRKGHIQNKSHRFWVQDVLRERWWGDKVRKDREWHGKGISNYKHGD